MFALVVMMAPLVVGAALIMLIARYAPNVARDGGAGGAIHDARPELTGDEFRDLIDELTRALGLTSVFSSMGTGGVVEMTLRDERPLSGGRILLMASPTLPSPIDAVDVLGFAEGVRADMGAMKGILIALAGFTDAAKTAIAATPAPVELIDGAALLELVRSQLSPERAAELASYRGFGPDAPARKSPPAARPTERSHPDDDGQGPAA